MARDDIKNLITKAYSDMSFIGTAKSIAGAKAKIYKLVFSINDYNNKINGRLTSL